MQEEDGGSIRKMTRLRAATENACNLWKPTV